MDLPYSRFLQAVRVAAEEKSNQHKEQLHLEAFGAWQLRGVFGGKQKSFKAYLKQLGLIEKEHVTKEQVAAEKARAFAALERVEAEIDGKGGRLKRVA